MLVPALIFDAEKETLKNKVHENQGQKNPLTWHCCHNCTNASGQQMLALEMWVTAPCSTMSMGSSGLTLWAYVSLACFYFACLYDKHFKEGLFCVAHYASLSVMPDPVSPGVVWMCSSCCNTDLHSGVGRADGLNGWRVLWKQGGTSLVPHPEVLGSLNTSAFSAFTGQHFYPYNCQVWDQDGFHRERICSRSLAQILHYTAE